MNMRQQIILVSITFFLQHPAQARELDQMIPELPVEHVSEPASEPAAESIEIKNVKGDTVKENFAESPETKIESVQTHQLKDAPRKKTTKPSTKPSKETDDGSSTESVLDRTTIKAVRVQHLSVFNSGGNSFSGLLSWIPSYQWSDSLKFQLHVGFSFLKNNLNKTFGVLESAVSVGVGQFYGFSFELTAGVQSWIDNGGVKPLLGFGTIYTLNNNRGFFSFQHIAVGYAAYLNKNNTAHELRAGAGFSF